MQFKKIVAIGAIVLALFLSGCQPSSDESMQNSTTSQTTSQTATLNSAYEATPIPEGGWTVEELAKTIRINGKPVEIPFTIDGLGENYKINDKYTFWKDDETTVTITVMYHNIDFMVAYITDIENKDINTLTSKDITRFTINDIAFNSEALKIISINGIVVSSTKEEVIYALGEPNMISGSSLIYNDATDESKMAAITMNNDVVTGLTVYLKDK